MKENRRIKKEKRNYRRLRGCYIAVHVIIFSLFRLDYSVIDRRGFSLLDCGHIYGLLHLERVRPRFGLTLDSVRRRMFIGVIGSVAEFWREQSVRSPSDAVGNVGQQRPDDGSDQRGERAADGQQQVDEVGNGLVMMVRFVAVAAAVVHFRFPSVAAAGQSAADVAHHQGRATESVLLNTQSGIMLLLFAILNVYDLVAAFPTQDINIDQYNSFGTTIGPIFDKNMRSLNIENLTSDYSWDNKNFDVFLMSVPGLKPFVILRETADEKMTKVDGDEEDAFKVEEQNPRVDFNKIKYFSKSYHLGRINKQLGTHLDRI